MRGFLDNLVDPTRDVPFAVASMRTGEPDRDMLADRWTALARALAGLAAVWVLPPAMTFRLSDAVGKSRSAFKGAWRFYRPGFDDRADLSRHPLVLWDRLADERGLAAATTQFQRLAAEERLRFGPGDRDTLGFDAIAGEAAAAPRGTRRLVALVRNAIRRDSAAPKSGSRGDRAATAVAERGPEARSGAGEGVRVERPPPHGGLAHQERREHAEPETLPAHLLFLGRRHPQRGGRLDAGPPEERADLSAGAGRPRSLVPGEGGGGRGRLSHGAVVWRSRLGRWPPPGIDETRSDS